MKISDIFYLLFGGSVFILSNLWTFRLFCKSNLPKIKPRIVNRATSNSNSNKKSADIENAMYNQQQPKASNIPKYAKVMSTIHLTLSWITFLNFTIFGTYVSPMTYCIIFPFNYNLIFIARVTLYLYYFERVRRTFLGTSLAIPPCRRKCIISWFIIGYTLSAISYYLFVIIYGCPIDFSNDSANLLALAWPLINELMISIFCLIYFIRKIRSLIKEIGSNPATNASYLRMNYVMRKLVILTSTSVISSFALVLVSGLGLTFAFTLENLIVNLCMILSFSFMGGVYEKLCCCCIRCCCCLSTAVDVVKQDVVMDSKNAKNTDNVTQIV